MDIAASLDIDHIERITFTAADKGAPSFEAIRNRMVAIKKTLPISGIYSMGQRNGLLYFGPESYPENDPLASPPGTEYKSPPLEALSIFNIKKPRTVGPYTDEYALSEATQDALIMIDQVGRICCWNSAAERMLGYRVAEALDRSLHDMVFAAVVRSTIANQAVRNRRLMCLILRVKSSIAVCIRCFSGGEKCGDERCDLLNV
jgi:PAS domain-containing protein